MKNSTVLGIVVVLLGIIGSLGYLYNQQKSINENLSIDNSKYERDIAFANSLSERKDSIILELDSAYKAIEIENANFKWELEKIEEQNDSLLNILSNMTDDSIGQRVIDVFGGDTYRILEIDDSTFIAYKIITSVNILKQDIAHKALFKRFQILSTQLDTKNKLVKLQAKKIVILTTDIEELLNKHKDLINDNRNYQEEIIDLTTEVDKQKNQKRIAVIVGGVLLCILIIL